MPATHLTWIALILVCSFAVFAQGGPPLLTDDPGTPGNRRSSAQSRLNFEGGYWMLAIELTGPHY